MPKRNRLPILTALLLPAGALLSAGEATFVSTTPPEYSGVFGTGESIEFSLAVPGSGRPRWIRLRDPKAPYFVESHDPKSDTITVRLAGGSKRIALRKEAPPTGVPLFKKNGGSTTPDDLPEVPPGMQLTVYEVRPEETDGSGRPKERVIIVGPGPRDADDPGLYD